jgi:hypothetical protein
MVHEGKIQLLLKYQENRMLFRQQKVVCGTTERLNKLLTTGMKRHCEDPTEDEVHCNVTALQSQSTVVEIHTAMQ